MTFVTNEMTTYRLPPKVRLTRKNQPQLNAIWGVRSKGALLNSRVARSGFLEPEAA